MDCLLLPFEAALPRKRKLPPPVRVPLTYQERVDLFAWRHSAGYLLWHPADNFDHDPMTLYGFAGQPRESNGTDRTPTRMVTISEMVDEIRRKAARKGMTPAELRADEFACRVAFRSAAPAAKDAA